MFKKLLISKIKIPTGNQGANLLQLFYNYWHRKIFISESICHFLDYLPFQRASAASNYLNTNQIIIISISSRIYQRKFHCRQRQRQVQRWTLNWQYWEEKWWAMFAFHFNWPQLCTIFRVYHNPQCRIKHHKNVMRKTHSEHSPSVIIHFVRSTISQH